MRSTSTIITALAVIALATAGCSGTGTSGSQTPEPSALAAAVEQCANTELGDRSDWLTVADGGSTLLIDHDGAEDMRGATIDEVACVLAEIGIPDSVAAQIDSTRALDGRQSASWDGYEVSWSYHPDTGMDMIVTQG